MDVDVIIHDITLLVPWVSHLPPTPPPHPPLEELHVVSSTLFGTKGYEGSESCQQGSIHWPARLRTISVII